MIRVLWLKTNSRVLDQDPFTDLYKKMISKTVYFFGKLIASKAIPIIAERSEAVKIPTFATSTYADSVNASSEINIDIVKPIPARNETPNNCFQLTPSGRTVIFNLIARFETSEIPYAFTINKPPIIHIDIG